MMKEREPVPGGSEEELVRVYRVTSPHFGDYITTEWEGVVNFLATECEPEDTGPEWDGHEATIASEHMTRTILDEMPEWSP